MTCSPTDMETALRLLRAGYPGYNPQIDGETLALWHLAVSAFTGAVVIAASTEWAQSEERFPTLVEFLRECKGAERKLRSREIGTGERGTARCLECDDLGMVCVDDVGQGSYRPCSRCRPQQTAKHRSGHYMRNHDCADCADERRFAASKAKR